MKRLMIATALLTALGLSGCRLFEPEPAPVYCAPAYYQQCQPCPQVCAPATTQCLPAPGAVQQGRILGR